MAGCAGAAPGFCCHRFVWVFPYTNEGFLKSGGSPKSIKIISFNTKSRSSDLDVLGVSEVSSGKLTYYSYWTLPFIVDLPIKNGDFHNYVSLPEGTHNFEESSHLWESCGYWLRIQGHPGMIPPRSLEVFSGDCYQGEGINFVGKSQYILDHEALLFFFNATYVW